MTRDSNPYRAAGTFAGPSYAVRQADKDLLRAIIENQRFPYVLAPRQSGKSSLLAHARRELKPPEFRSAFIDLSVFERTQFSSLEEFQERFLDDLSHSAMLVPPSSKGGRFLEHLTAILEQCRERRLIVFVDEIDTLRQSRFGDTFLSILRNVFNERALVSELTRVQFVLAGAARASDLISDPLRSPFNVGESIVLEELSQKEMGVVCAHLASAVGVDDADLAATVYALTSGSVYLTQLVLERLWARLVTSESRGSARALGQEAADLADDIVKGAREDLHFQHIRNTILSAEDAKHALSRVLAGGNVTSSEREILWFTGLSPRVGGAFRNRLYERVFGRGGPLDLVEPVTWRSPLHKSTAGRVIGASLLSLALVVSAQVAVEVSVWRESRLLSGKVLAAEPDALDEMVGTYSSLAERSSLGFGTWPARLPLLEALTLNVDRVILDFRQPEPTVRQNRWRQARAWAAKALELRADDALRARFLLCDAHVKRIDGDVAIRSKDVDRGNRLLNDADSQFRESARLNRANPDAWLGLLRLHSGARSDPDRAQEDLNEAARRGWTPRALDYFRIGEATRARAEVLEMGCDDQRSERLTECLSRARDLQKKAIDWYDKASDLAVGARGGVLAQRAVDRLDARIEALGSVR